MEDETILRLDNEEILAIRFADAQEGTCDSCVDIYLYSAAGKLLESGQMEFNQDEADYDAILDTVDDVLDFLGRDDQNYDDLGLEWDAFQDFKIGE